MRVFRSRLAFLLLAVPIIGLSVLVSDVQIPLMPAPPDDAPKAIIALGDSAMSGEGAGSYEPETAGQQGNWCHRSTKALVHRTAVPEVTKTINLACSGANADAVAMTNRVQHTETSQTRRLETLASQYRVLAVVVQVGANDDPNFGTTVKDCMEAWLRSTADGCAKPLTQSWDQRIGKMVPKVQRALDDIRTAMRRTGYPDFSYSLVLQSYAAPVGRSVAPQLRNLNGCPFRTGDLEWVQDKAVNELAAGLHRAANRSNARFLDLSKAAIGREACSKATAASAEWFTRLAVNWDDLGDDQRSAHAMQESFHPNANAHDQFGRCLTQFLATQDRAAACLADDNGNLRPVPDAATAARTPN